MQHKQYVGIMNQNPPWQGAPPQDLEERDAPDADTAYSGFVSRETEEAQSETASGYSGRLLGWGDDTKRATTSPNIWSHPIPRTESSSPYGYYGDGSVNTFYRSTNDSFENDVVTSMASLSFQPQPNVQPSSLASTASRGVYGHPSSLASAASTGPYGQPRSLASAASTGPYGVPHSTSSIMSGASTIPGLVGLSSGSTNAGLHQDFDGMDSRRKQPSSLATASRRPPPGFVLPIQSSKQRDDDSSRGGPRSWDNRSRGRRARGQSDDYSYSSYRDGDSTATSEALRALMNPVSSASISTLEPVVVASPEKPILPEQSLLLMEDLFSNDDDEDDDSSSWDDSGILPSSNAKELSPKSKKREWLLRMNRRLNEIPIGELDPVSVPLSAVMNAWAKTKSAQGAAMVEMWLNRAQQEYDCGNLRVIPTTKLYTMAVDAWAKSGEGGAAATRAEAILQHMNHLYQSGGHDDLKPTTGIFNAVINAWARSREKIAPMRAEQILEWMEKLCRNGHIDIKPDKYTFNTGKRNVS